MISVGDQVLDEHGKPCSVVAIYDAYAPVCYRMHFTNGAFVDACSEHLWVVLGRRDVAPSPYTNWARRSPVDTQFLYDNYRDNTFYIPAASHLDNVGATPFQVSHISRISGQPMRCITVDSPNSMYLCTPWYIPTHNTRASSEITNMYIRKGKAKYVGIFARTPDDAAKTLITGPSGLLNTCHPDFMPEYNKKDGILYYPNGAVLYVYSGANPEKARGPDLDFVWLDELCAWKFMEETFYNLDFALRRTAPDGSNACGIISTTPKASRWLRSFMVQPDVHVTSESSYANVVNLDGQAVASLRARYEGTRLGEQELHAKVLDDAGALWTWDTIAACRGEPPAFSTFASIVIGVDPSVSSSANSDETGIIVAGVDATGLYWIIADASGKYSPSDWAKKAIAAYKQFKAVAIIVEKNNGGDMCEQTIKAVDPTVTVVAVHASKGKLTRAEPIAALYEQGKVHHARTFNHLEAQMTGYTGNPREKSPDRMDAMVWAMSHLLSIQSVGSVDDYFEMW